MAVLPFSGLFSQLDTFKANKCGRFGKVVVFESKVLGKKTSPNALFHNKTEKNWAGGSRRQIAFNENLIFLHGLAYKFTENNAQMIIEQFIKKLIVCIDLKSAVEQLVVNTKNCKTAYRGSVWKHPSPSCFFYQSSYFVVARFPDSSPIIK